MFVGSSMENDNYLKVKKTTPYYNLLKSIHFPSLRSIIFALFLVTFFGGYISFIIVDQANQALRGGLLGLLCFFLPSVLSDYLLSQTIEKDESIFNLRRLSALSLFSSVLWAITMIMGAVISLITELKFPEDALYIWLFILLPIRLLIISSILNVSSIKRFFTSILPPSICMLLFSINISISLDTVIIGIVAAIIIGYLYVSWLLYIIEKIGFSKLGVSPVSMFKSILKVLLDKDNRELESILNDLSIDRDLDIVLIGFRKTKNKQLKSGIIVSNFHPGPFLNVGSSVLPYKIIDKVKELFKISIAVPHGISGHEMNLVSQNENSKVIKTVIDMFNANKYYNAASKFYSASIKGAHSTCQIFGECPLITLTLSPNDMEDVPLHTGYEIQDYVQKFYQYGAIVDSHNCIDKVTILSDKDLTALKQSSFRALDKSVKHAKTSIEFGVAEIVFQGCKVSDGIGSGGGIVQIVKVGSQKSAYITLDSNNMIKGLRETIIRLTENMGISQSEVMTTDTHEVNGLISAKLGYYPLGEKIKISYLLSKIENSIKMAIADLETVDVFHNYQRIKVKVLGLRLFGELSSLGYHLSRILLGTLIPTLVLSTLIFMLMK